MPAQVTNYQCPSCTGPLHFAGSTGRLECEYCGSSFSVEEIEKYYAEKDGSAAGAAADDDAPALLSDEERASHAQGRWDDSALGSDWGADAEGLRTYGCPSCGAELVCGAETAAMQCPYCGNPAIVPGQFTGRLKPDCVIPFRLDKAAAVAQLKKHFRRRPFLPRTFTSEHQLGKIQGVYVPFWLFSAEAAAECCYACTNSHTRREGDYRVTRTDHFDVRRYGTVRFERIPADASKKLGDALMDSLEPFDYSALKPFSSAYLPGFLADKYDVSVDEAAPRADARCTATAEDAMRATVGIYQTVLKTHSDISVRRGQVQYALLPVWLLPVSWNGKEYLFAMNGQTGKLVGDLPVSEKRFWGICGAMTAGLTLVCYLTGLGASLVRLLGG